MSKNKSFKEDVNPLTLIFECNLDIIKAYAYSKNELSVLKYSKSYLYRQTHTLNEQHYKELTNCRTYCIFDSSS